MIKGFTLVELIVAIAILGILSSLTVMSYNDYVRKGVVKSAFSEISSLKADYELTFNENYSGFNTFQQLSSIKSEYCLIRITPPNASNLIAEKAISCSFKNSRIFGTGAEIYLDRTIDGVYNCYVENIPKQYTPKQCSYL